MSGQGKTIGGITTILGILTALVLLMARCQDLRKSSAEADLAEQRRRAELDAASKKSPLPTPSPPEVGQNKKGPPGGEPKVSVSELVSRTITVGRKLESPVPRVEITLVKIEMRTDRRVRWHFTFWNRSGTDSTHWWVAEDHSYMTDDGGNRSDCLGVSNKDAFSVPDGQKLNLWVDFQEPVTNARTLTAYFKPFEFYKTVQNVVAVELPK